MLAKLKSKKGVSFLDVMVSLVILLAFTGMMVSATQFMARNQQQVRQLTEYNQVVNNTVMKVYAEPNWATAVAKDVDTLDGLVTITYEYAGSDTAYLTERMTATFTQDGRTETYTLERSLYANE